MLNRTLSQLLIASLLSSAAIALPAQAQDAVSAPDGKITDQTVLFNFRGIPITASDLPHRTISCRMYLAKPEDPPIGAMFRKQYREGGSLDRVNFLSRLSMQITFDQDWQNAKITAKSENYIFKPLHLEHGMLPVTDKYDTLKSIDPDHSPDKLLKRIAQHYLKRKWESQEMTISNLTVRFAPVPDAYDPAVSGNSIHIFDRVSDPNFYLRISESADAVYDEWLPQLFGDETFLKGKVIPKFGGASTVLREAATLATGWTTIGMLFAPVDLSGDPELDIGAYCQLGTPADLDQYETLPLGRNSHNPSTLNP